MKLQKPAKRGYRHLDPTYKADHAAIRGDAMLPLCRICGRLVMLDPADA